MMRLLCLALVIALASAKITYKDCGHSEVKDVDVSSCSSSPCTVQKGKEVTITAVFVANQDTNTAKIEVDAKLGELEIQVPEIETNACKFMTCPIKKGETKTIKYVLTVPTSAPALDVDLVVKMVGEHGVLACGSTKASIKD